MFFGKRRKCSFPGCDNFVNLLSNYGTKEKPLCYDHSQPTESSIILKEIVDHINSKRNDKLIELFKKLMLKIDAVVLEDNEKIHFEIIEMFNEIRLNILPQAIEKNRVFVISYILRLLLNYVSIYKDKIEVGSFLSLITEWIDKEIDKGNINEEIAWSYNILLTIVPYSDAEKVIRRIIIIFLPKIVSGIEEKRKEDKDRIEKVIFSALWALGSCSKQDIFSIKNYLSSVSNIFDEIKKEENKLKEEFNDRINKLEELRQKLFEYDNSDGLDRTKVYETELMINLLFKEIEEIKNKLKVFLILYFLNKLEISPVCALVQVIKENPLFNRYIEDGAVRGLKAFLNRVKLDCEDYISINEIVNVVESNIDQYEVRMFAGGGIGEVSYLILNSLRASGNNFTDLSKVIKVMKLIREDIYNFADFISLYPLYIFPINRYKSYLGYFRIQGNFLEFWTSYIPPKEVGEVQDRFLRINDRMVPNGMGIAAELFEDPILVSTVLYHEFLHYAGTPDNGNRAIDNEAEVWLREQIYFRYLIAKEKCSIDQIIHLLKVQLSYLDLFAINLLMISPENTSYLYLLNQLILNLYGEQLNEEEAERYAEKQIEYFNSQIIEINNSIKWCPEKKWPLLISNDSDDYVSQEIRDELKKLIIKYRMRRNVINVNDQRRIFSEPTVRKQLQLWNEYKKNYKDPPIQ